MRQIKDVIIVCKKSGDSGFVGDAFYIIVFTIDSYSRLLITQSVGDDDFHEKLILGLCKYICEIKNIHKNN